MDVPFIIMCRRGAPPLRCADADRGNSRGSRPPRVGASSRPLEAGAGRSRNSNLTSLPGPLCRDRRTSLLSPYHPTALLAPRPGLLARVPSYFSVGAIERQRNWSKVAATVAGVRMNTTVRIDGPCNSGITLHAPGADSRPRSKTAGTCARSDACVSPRFPGFPRNLHRERAMGMREGTRLGEGCSAAQPDLLILVSRNRYRGELQRSGVANPHADTRMFESTNCTPGAAWRRATHQSGARVSRQYPAFRLKEWGAPDVQAKPRKRARSPCDCFGAPARRRVARNARCNEAEATIPLRDGMPKRAGARD